MIERIIIDKIREQLGYFPVVTLTGTRQCGKSTLLKGGLNEFSYVSLEEPDVRNIAASDPKGFLSGLKLPVIIDEAQYVPALFSYIQTLVDNTDRCGQILLSGSHNFLLMEKITQSLAGRAAVLKLAPFSMNELRRAGRLSGDIDEIMFRGMYPRIHDKGIPPMNFFPSLIQTYIERDVRLIRNIPDADLFRRFLHVMAARSGQVINHTELGISLGISQPTLKAWISILKESYIIFSLPPYYKNINKRLVKSSKLYFYDTGLLCYLLGITDVKMLKQSESRGAVFETFMVSEYVKGRMFKGLEPDVFFVRDTNQNEIDLMTGDADPVAYEIKSSSEMNEKHFSSMKKMADILGLRPENCNCIYTGAMDMRLKYGNFISYGNAFRDE